MLAWATKAALVKIAPFAIIALISVLGVSHFWAYGSGVTRERDRQESALRAVEQEAKARQEALADELERARKERRVVYRDRVRYVDRVVDPLGCGDVAVPDGVLDRLPGGARAREQADSPR